MSEPLDEYHRKRDFDVTPEPSGDTPASGVGARTFVVHKHAARALHYDVRLEIDGVLASWAVPKGPSYDTADRHLAVHVEDHPLEYGSFEGVIPQGEYGGGTVMVWDRGTYEPVGDPASMLASGNLKVVLSGEKLRGGWALVRMRPRPGERREMWLLIKERDGAERPRAAFDVLAALPDSAATGRTMDQIGAEGRTYGGASAPDASRPEREAGTMAAVPAGAPAAGHAAASLADAAGAPFQLASPADVAPDGDGWLHEVKYDGYRVRVVIQDGRARVLTRGGIDWTSRFEAIADAAAALPAKAAVIDGEAVAFDPEGRTDFGQLQEALSEGRADAADLAAFDLLYLDGFDLRTEPLLRRKELLRALLGDGAVGPLRYVDHVEGRGPAFHASTCALLLEGSVSKRGDRPWAAGRSRDWVKVKCLGRQEFVVVGYTPRASGEARPAALLLGYHEAGGALRYAGRVAASMSERAAERLQAALDDIGAALSPVVPAPLVRGARWVEPRLVAEVRFQGWTSAGRVRQATWVGLREDADPAGVTRETAWEPTSAPVSAGIGLTNPSKLLEPAGISKRRLAAYYEAVTAWMLPHVAGRLVTAVRCPAGSSGAPGCFYQKHPEPKGWPAALSRVRVMERSGASEYFRLDDVAGLAALVQLGTLEIHPWNSLADDPERPDRLIFDLDPGPGVLFPEVRRAAVTVRDALAALGLRAFAKTTGGAGLHVVVPILPGASFDDARAWSRALAQALERAEPARFTASMALAEREGRVYVDYLRNAHGATAVAAYSTRARPGGPVSMPVTWDELDALDDPGAVTIDAVERRLSALRVDPWSGFDDARVALDRDLYVAIGLEPAAGPPDGVPQGP